MCTPDSSCPHAVLIPWGRDDTAVLCRLDDGPCDESRAGICPEYGGKEDKPHAPA